MGAVKERGIQVELAKMEEAAPLTDLQVRSFDDDTRRHLGIERGGPTGYDSLEYSEDLIENHRFYVIKMSGQIIGGAVIAGPTSGVLRINRLFLAPEERNKGYGSQAMNLIEDLFPQADRLVLDTPIWARRNQHFYEQLGYLRVGENFEPEAGFVLIGYERRRGEGR